MILPTFLLILRESLQHIGQGPVHAFSTTITHRMVRGGVRDADTSQAMQLLEERRVKLFAQIMVNGLWEAKLEDKFFEQLVRG